MRISMIAAMSENRVIGVNNKLPWHLPADLHYFKKLTTGHPIIMGRKTFASIGRPLPNRVNIILTQDPHFAAPGCIVTHALNAAITAAGSADEVFIIGGATLYQQFLASAHRIYLTVIKSQFSGDAFFPELGDDWHEVSKEEHVPDHNNPYPYAFVILDRNK
jgi:dihydrofolate reductase